MLKISCLNDDRCNIDDLESKHGLSLYIENDDTKILFDVGQGHVFKDNATKLNIPLSNIEYLVLSHGHYDHTDGIKYIDKKINILCHPNCVIERKSKRTNKNSGIPYSKEELDAKFNVTFSKDSFKINENIIFLGEISRNTDFECKEFPSVLSNGDIDKVIDDTGIAINTIKGIVVISGCSHSGICNTIEQAKRLFEKNKVHCVIGGFHLKECNDQTYKTIEYIKNNNIERLILGHCTSDIVCEEFIKQLSPTINVEVLKTGEKYII